MMIMEDLDKELIQWGEWCIRREDGGLGRLRSCLDGMQHVDCSAGEWLPLLTITDHQAMDIERAVSMLPEVHKAVVRVWYAMPMLTVPQKTRRLGVHEDTMRRYLKDAKLGVSKNLSEIRERKHKKMLDGPFRPKV